MVFDILVTYITDMIQTMGYTSVFILMILESMIFPVPSEAVMPFAGILVAKDVFNLYLLTVISGIASLVGSLLSYYIGKYGGLPFLEKYGKYFLLSHKDLEWSHRFFNKYGNWAILLSRFIPVVRHVISIPAGIAKMDLKKFIWATFLGATTWNFILIYTGIKLGENWTVIEKYTKYLDIFVIIGIIIGIIWFLKRHVKQR